MIRRRIKRSGAWAAFKAVGGGVLLVAVGGATLAGCISPPRAVGPTTLEGPLPSPQTGAEANASRAPGATDGPLLLRDSRFRWTHTASTEATYEWSCTVENPTDENYRVTVVVQIFDDNGRQVATTNQAFRIDRRARLPIDGQGVIEGPLATSVAERSRWRLEYWVQVPPRPIRDAGSDDPELTSGSADRRQF